MNDVLTPDQRKYCMSQVRSKNTKPEMLVRSVLHREGFRFKLHVKDLPGHPDIVLPRFKTVVFVNGCFWHGHSCPNAKLPTSNMEFWKEKIEKNIKRDKKNIKELKKTRWNVRVLWDCDIQSHINTLLKYLKCMRSE
ncbi:very short patch repair endonuclease [Acidobacteriota bacterium]